MANKEGRRGAFSASGPITFTGEKAFTRDCREWRRGNRTVDCVVRYTSTDAVASEVENAGLRDAIGTDGKKSSSSSSSATVASMSGCFDEYAFTEVCFSTDGASIVAKVQRIPDENDWTLRSWTFSDLTKRINVSNGGNVSSNQDVDDLSIFCVVCLLGYILCR